MAKRPLIVGNWKMNLTLDESVAYASSLKKKFKDAHGVEVVVCPGPLALAAVAKSFQNTDLEVGAQNIAHREQGPLTGEVAASQLAGLASYVIAGHSERRIVLGERDSEVAAKIAQAILHDLTPILCVGETLHDYEEGLSARVVNSELTNGLRDLHAKEVEKLVIAYEPVWAIGTGRPCTPRAAGEMMAGIRNVIAELYGEKAGEKVRVLYGGSVTPLNAEAYLDLSSCDGLLVGGASLELGDFIGIIKEAELQGAGA